MSESTTIERRASIDLTTQRDLAELHETASVLAEAARASSTHLAYSKGWDAFALFARTHGLEDPMQATPAVVRFWLADMFSAGLAISTVKQRLSAVNQQFKGAGLDSPASMRHTVTYELDGMERVETLGQVFKGLRRRAGERPTSGRGGKAKALRADDIVAMLRLIRGDDLISYRDRLLIALGFGGFLRRSELVALNLSDLEPMADGSVRVTIRSSKTDQEGRGVTVEARCGREVRPADLLADWLEASGIESGPVFRSITRGGNVKDGQLSDRSVSRILKARAGAAGIDSTKVSGHSLRRGAATSARAAGADALSICRAGRWADGSAVVNGYLEEVDSKGLELGW